MIKIVNGTVVQMTTHEIAEREAEQAVTPSHTEALASMFQQLDRKRRAFEEGGIIFSGMPLKTDRQTAAIITAAYVKASADASFAVPNWKFADGVFGTLDADTIIAAGDAISAHVQSAFDREAAITADLLALTAVEEVVAFDLEGAWAALEP